MGWELPKVEKCWDRFNVYNIQALSRSQSRKTSEKQPETTELLRLLLPIQHAELRKTLFERISISLDEKLDNHFWTLCLALNGPDDLSVDAHLIGSERRLESLQRIIHYRGRSDLDSSFVLWKRSLSNT